MTTGRAGLARCAACRQCCESGVSDEGLFRSFARVIDGVADARLRIYLYHIPPVAQVGTMSDP